MNPLHPFQSWVTGASTQAGHKAVACVLRAALTALPLAAGLACPPASAVTFTYTPVNAVAAQSHFPQIVVDYASDNYLGTTFEVNWDRSFGEGINHTTYRQNARLTTDSSGQVVAWTASGLHVFDRYPGTRSQFSSSLQGSVFDEWYSAQDIHFERSVVPGAWVTTVPEPATTAAWIAGLALLGLRIRRRRTVVAQCPRKTASFGRGP